MVPRPRTQPLDGHPRRRARALPPGRVREQRAPAARRARRPRRGAGRRPDAHRPRRPGTRRSARGKESVVCDLKHGRWRSRGRSAPGPTSCSRASGPGVAARLGVGPDDLPPSRRLLLDHRLRDRRAAMRARAGHDLNYLGWAGVLEDTPPCAAGPGRRPRGRARSARSTEVLAALVRRERTGEGARLVVSMTHGSHELVAHRLGGEPGAAAPHRRRSRATGVYATADGRRLTRRARSSRSSSPGSAR